MCFALCTLKCVLVCTLQMLLYIRHNTLYFLCTSLYVFLHFFILCTSMHVANVFMHPKQHLHQARPGKQIFYKKGPKNRLFRGDTIQVMSLRRELEAKPVTSGQLLGHPWKVWDITLQMSYVEAWWHQNWVHSRPILCRGGADTEIIENLCFFYKTVRSPKFTNWNFSGAGTHGFSTHSAFRISIWKVCKKIFCPSYSCPKSGEGGKTGSASKNRHRNEKKTRPQFSKESSENE